MLTGAGISTESGIPDFRTPGSGLWSKLDPEDFTIQRFQTHPERFYQLGMDFVETILNSSPNPAHKAIGEMESLGLVKSVITQNVDSLHQKGGSRRVIEIHGTLQTASCMLCSKQINIKDAMEEVNQGVIPPRCKECNGLMKPDVTLFGEAMPPAYQEALAEAQKADGMLVVGSSLVVSPANILPQFMEKLIIVNRERTPYNDRADEVISNGISEVVPKLKDALLERKIS